MSDRYSGNRCNQPWLRRYSGGQNVGPRSLPLAINNPSDDLLIEGLEHISFFIPQTPPPSNLRIGMVGGGGSKAYYRYHGGIGDGRGGMGWRPIEELVTARPIQLFQAMDPIAFDNERIKNVVAAKDGSSKNPMTGKKPEASIGTGVFLPVYPTGTASRSTWKGAPSTKVFNKNGGKCVGDGNDRNGHVVGVHGRAGGGHGRNGCVGVHGRVGGGYGRNGCVGEQKKQEDDFVKRFAKEKKHVEEDLDEIPMESFLPPDWPY